MSQLRLSDQEWVVEGRILRCIREYNGIDCVHQLGHHCLVAEHPPAVRIFISYSHDSDLHKNRVLALAGRLRNEGVDARIDQYEPNPSEGWPHWMRRQIREADHILVVCSATYRRRFEGTETAGRGNGAKWESVLIKQELYENGGINTRLVPVFFEGDSAQDIPDVLRPFTRYPLLDGYDDLYRYLTKQPELQQPSLGSVRQMAPRAEPVITEAEERQPLHGTVPDSTFVAARVQELSTRSNDSTGARTSTTPSIESGTSIIDALETLSGAKILVVGSPGAGKTTTLKRVAHTRSSDDLATLSVLVPLRDASEDLRSLIAEQCAAAGVDDTSVYEGHVRLLFDGVNELSTSDQRKQLRRFVNNHPKIPMVLTSRDTDDDLEVSYVLELLPLDAFQIERFVRARLEADKAEDMLRRLRPHAGLAASEPARVPMLLAWQCDAFDSTGTLPAGTAETLDTFVRSYERRRYREAPESKVGRWGHAMEALAACMTNAARLIIHESEAANVLMGLLKDDKEPSPARAAEKLREELLQRHLLKRRGDSLEMVHQLVQEYYAARWLQGKLNELLADSARLRHEFLNQVAWTTPFELLVARLDRDRVHLLISEAVTVDILLAARLLGAAATEHHSSLLSVLGLNTHPTVIELSALIHMGSAATLDRVNYHLRANDDSVLWDALEALQAIGSPAAAEELARQLVSEKGHYRRCIARLLIPIANERCLTPLLHAMRSTDEQTRRAAFQAVVGIPGLEQHRRLDEVARSVIEFFDPSPNSLCAPSSPALIRILERVLEIAPQSFRGVAFVTQDLREHAKALSCRINMTALFRDTTVEVRKQLLWSFESSWAELAPTVVVEHFEHALDNAVGCWLTREDVNLPPKLLAQIVRLSPFQQEHLGRAGKQAIAALEHSDADSAKTELIDLTELLEGNHIQRVVLLASLRGHGHPDLDSCLQWALHPLVGGVVMDWILKKEDPIIVRRLAERVRDHGGGNDHRRFITAVHNAYGLCERGWILNSMERVADGARAPNASEFDHRAAQLEALGHDSVLFDLVYECTQERDKHGAPNLEAASLLAWLRPDHATNFVDDLAQDIAQRCSTDDSARLDPNAWWRHYCGAFLVCVARFASDRGATAYASLATNETMNWGCEPRSAAIQALSTIAQECSLRWFLQHLHHDNVQIRRVLIQALPQRAPEFMEMSAELKAKLAIDLRQLLLDGPAAPIFSVWNALDPNGAGLHVAELICENKQETWLCLFELLDEANGGEVGLRRLLDDDNPAIRAETLNLLLRLRKVRKPWARIRQLADDSDPAVRVAALVAMAHGNHDVDSRLVALLDDKCTAGAAIDGLRSRTNVVVFQAFWERRHELTQWGFRIELPQRFESLDPSDRRTFLDNQFAQGPEGVQRTLELAYGVANTLPFEDVVTVVRMDDSLSTFAAARAIDVDTLPDPDPLRVFLEDPSERVRTVTLHALRDLERYRAIVAEIAGDRSHPASEAAFLELRSLPSHLEETAIDALATPGPRQDHATTLLLAAGAQRAFPLIVPIAAADPTMSLWSLLQHACEQLADELRPQIADLILESLPNNAPWVRETVCENLALAGGPEATQILLRHVSRPTSTASHCLVKLAHRETTARTAILEAIASGKQWALWIPTQNLPDFPPHALEDALLVCSQRVSDSILTQVVHLLGQCDGHAVWTRLTELTEHHDHSVGWAAVHAKTQQQSRTGRYLHEAMKL